MKLLRYGPAGGEKPGLLDASGQIRDLSGIVPDITGRVLGDAELARLKAIDPTSLPIVTGTPRLGAPVGQVGAFLAIGLNYREHAAEIGREPPSEPILFMKGTHCIAGPNDDVTMPRGSVKTDWELELGVVIGTRAKYVSKADALSHVAGYLTVNDLSERTLQMEGTGQWVKGKACDGYGPLGPWLVTRDEVPDPQNLDLWLEVDGHRYQDGNTRSMIFGVAEIVSFLSTLFTLHPGDVITTGSPVGTGMGHHPAVFLKAGNVVRGSVVGLGVQEYRILAG